MSIERECLRFRAALTRLRGLTDALEALVRDDGASASTRQALTSAAVQVSEHAAVIASLRMHVRGSGPHAEES